MRKTLAALVFVVGCTSSATGDPRAPGPMNDAPADADAGTDPSEFETNANAQGVEAPALPSGKDSANAALREHAEDVVDYTFRASLDATAHVVHGSGRIHWKNTSTRPVREMFFHLYLNAFKNEASIFLRDPIGGFRGTGSISTWGAIDLKKLVLKRDVDQDVLAKLDVHAGDSLDETDARLPLDEEVAPGGTVDFDVEWDAKLPSIVMRTGFSDSFHMVGQWFPKVAVLEKDGTWAHFPFHHLSEFYADFGTYDVTIDVPDAFIIGATGPVTSASRENGRRVERHVQADIHDFAWTAWDQWQELRETIQGVDVRVFYPPGYGPAANRDLDAVRFAIPHFGERYGKYPYPVLTVVHPRERDSEAGGMEYPTFITSAGPWYGPPGVHVAELVTIHEFGHQWFYGLLASNEARSPFLDEGLNSYAESIALESYFGTGGVFDALGIRLSGYTIQGVPSRRAAHTEPVARGSGEFATGSDYGSLVYSRTAALLETVSRVYGKEAMKRAMRRYATDYRFLHPLPEDFLASIESSLGGEARAMLEQGFFHRGWVDYEPVMLDCGTSRDAAGIFDRNGARQTVPIGQTSTEARDVGVTLMRRGTIVLPVVLELTFDDGSTQRLHWDGRGETTRLTFKTNRALTSARVDPDRLVLIDEDYSNNLRICTARDARKSSRLFSMLAFFGELLANGVSP